MVFVGRIIHKKVAVMNSHIPTRYYSYDFRSFFIRASVGAAIAVTIYRAVFGPFW